MEGNFSNRVQDVIRLSREEAIRLGHDYIGTEHLLLGIIREGEGIAVKILRNLGVDLYKLKKQSKMQSGLQAAQSQWATYRSQNKLKKF
jgi:ATP-dependent Clp protease ATP-binding subunit ClpC